MAEPPRHFFRLRDNGAAVFRVTAEGPSQRLAMEQIAAVNGRTGEIRPYRGQTLTDDDTAAIRDWLAGREETLAARELDEVRRAVEGLNQTAHWLQGRASAAQVEEVADALLLAMHDLRTVIVRRKAEAAEGAASQAG